MLSVSSSSRNTLLTLAAPRPPLRDLFTTYEDQISIHTSKVYSYQAYDYTGWIEQVANGNHTHLLKLLFSLFPNLETLNVESWSLRFQSINGFVGALVKATLNGSGPNNVMPLSKLRIVDIRLPRGASRRGRRNTNISADSATLETLAYLAMLPSVKTIRCEHMLGGTMSLTRCPSGDHHCSLTELTLMCVKNEEPNGIMNLLDRLQGLKKLVYQHQTNPVGNWSALKMIQALLRHSANTLTHLSLTRAGDLLRQDEGPMRVGFLLGFKHLLKIRLDVDMMFDEGGRARPLLELMPASICYVEIYAVHGRGFAITPWVKGLDDKGHRLQRLRMVRHEGINTEEDIAASKKALIHFQDRIESALFQYCEYDPIRDYDPEDEHGVC